MNENKKWSIYYEIKIYEYMIRTFTINPYAGKSFTIELIDYTTIQQSSFDNDTINGINYLFNKDSKPFIKCKIINSYINLFLEYPYDKEIIILCLYYSKDIVNSSPNEPKLSIRLDLFKSNIGYNELNLISYITIKNSIKIDKDDIDGINYLFPEMITFKNNEGEIYAILKGKKYTEIYTINLNINTLQLSNVQLNFSELYNNEIISFTPREFIGSFFVTNYNKENNKLNVYIYGDIFKNYSETKAEFDGPGSNIIKIIKTEITAISNYLLAILLISENDKVYIIFIQYPMCDPIPTKQAKYLKSGAEFSYGVGDLIPSDLTNSDYSGIFSCQNDIIDRSSRLNTYPSTNTRFDFDQNYLNPEEKDEYIKIEYDNSNRELKLNTNNHIENLKVFYNLYFQKDDNKFYSPTCQFIIKICHNFCKKCNDYSDDDTDPQCTECLLPNYYPLDMSGLKCGDINQIPIKDYYFDKTEQKFKGCNTACAYCIGPEENECLKCSNDGEFLLEENLNNTIINNKNYEYSNCGICNPNNYYYYKNYNFDDLSVNVCLEVSINKCPISYPFRLRLDTNISCYKNCKDSGTEYIYGSERNYDCLEECDNDYFIYENNTCQEDGCPPGYYYYALKFYCVKKCDKNLYHIKREKEDVENKKYFELKCESVCPISDMPYYFIDDENYRYCVPSCDQFEYYYGNEIEVKYNIYYKNTYICFSKSQCNNFIDEYSSKKYVAMISNQDSSKRVCITECKEVSQYLLPQSFIDLENNKSLGIDCTPECPEGYGNYSWKCIECSSIYYFEFDKNCVKECPLNSYRVNIHPYKCYSSCPSDFPYIDNVNYMCYSSIDELPKYDKPNCDKTKHLWYMYYDINNISVLVCLNDTNIYLTCDAVIHDYPYTNKATHECVKKCPDYTKQNEHTKFCELNLNIELDFTIIRDVLLTHELNNTKTKNESNIIQYQRDANSEFTISFYLVNYSTILEKLRNNINIEVSIQETNGDIRTDPLSPFYYPNGSEFFISEQCENLLRELYNIPYYNEIEYNETIIEFINGLKNERKETKYYYIPQYLLGLIMDIRRDNTSQVEYKLYKPNEPYMELNLGLCTENEDEKMRKVNIIIEKPLNNKIYSLFDEVYSYYENNIDENFEGKRSKDYIYDIFNKNSDFFSSPCTPFSSKYGTDILSVDRFDKFYTEINFCEKNCTYQGIERSYKNKGNNYILIKCACDLKDKYFKENEAIFGPVYDGPNPNYNISFQAIKSNFICFKKILNIKSIFSKENVLGLISLICFVSIIALYIIQCMVSTVQIEETIKLIRVGKYDHGINLFLNVKHYLKEQTKRDECYKRRKELKKVKLFQQKPKNMNLIEAKHKIKKAEKNIKLKFEGKEMIPDEKKDELELIRDRIKDLEDKIKLKYEKKGMKNKKIKIKLKEDPEEIKKIKQEIRISKKHLEELRKQKRDIDLEKLKYHSFSSMASLPPYPPKRVLSEMPMLDEIDDDAIISSKEKILNKSSKKSKKQIKDLKDKNKEKKKDNIKDNMKEEEKSKNNKKEINKEDILSINKLNNVKETEEEKKEEEIKDENDEEKKEETKEEKKEETKEENKEEQKEENKDEEIIGSKLNSSWESYDSKDPEGKNKKKQKKLKEKLKKQKEEKERELQKLIIEKRIKEIERRIELLPEEEKKQRKLLEKEKLKKEMVEKGLPIPEDIQNDKDIMNSENILITEAKEQENDDNNINNEITKNDITEENLSDMEEKESDNNEKISEKKTQNEIIDVKEKKVKDEFFKNILSKKYKFKYMKLFYEESPNNFIRDYSIINFNDLFTSNDFFYIYVDVEMNDMIYRRALKEDRRSFCQMYWSFLKYKNNFIFCVTKDYFNLITVKIALLIYSLSIYPFFSCLFINDKLIHNMYIESNKIQKHTTLKTDPISIVQYIFSPIIIELIFFLLKKFVLTEKDIIDFIHKKKYHSNYVLQEMVKGIDVRDENDEEEKKKILTSLQNMNKKKEDKDEEQDGYFVDDKTLKQETKKIDYSKEYEENRTLINEIRMETSNYTEKVNNRITFFFLGVFLLTLFHFYYVTVFTMVYYHCVEKIIFGSVLPLIVNFSYPIINCFIFVIIRYFALNRGYMNLYKFSKILSFI